jgi:ceramide glucosyltransferase
VITRPLPLALLALPFAPIAASAVALTALILRQIVARKVDRLAGERCLPLILLPVVDCLEFIVYVAAFGARSVDWRGSQLTIASKGRIAA